MLSVQIWVKCCKHTNINETSDLQSVFIPMLSACETLNQRNRFCTFFI